MSKSYQKIIGILLTFVCLFGLMVSPVMAASNSVETNRQKIVDLASKWVGSNVKYKNSSASKIINLNNYNPKKVPSNITLDCSSFAGSVYLTALNINLPRSSSEQQNQGNPVKFSINKNGTINGDLQNGDLIFLDYGKDGAADHVMIYVGNQNFIQMGGSGVKKYSFTTSGWLNSKDKIPVGKYVFSIRRLIK